MASGTERTTSGYIEHHLQNLQVCQNDAGEWVWNQCSGNFWALNVDSMFWAVVLGLTFCGIFGHVARNASATKPGKLQAFIEILVELVNSSVKEFKVQYDLGADGTTEVGEVSGLFRVYETLRNDIYIGTTTADADLQVSTAIANVYITGPGPHYGSLLIHSLPAGEPPHRICLRW